MFARLLSSLLLIFIFNFLFITPVSAQTATTSAIPSNVSPTSPLFTDLLVANTFHTFSCLGIGQSFIGQPCLTYQITRDSQGAVQGVPVLSQINTSGGVLGATTSLIGVMYLNPPVRSSEYLASVGRGLGVVKEAQAQVVGSGQAVLDPIYKLWEISRNISYVAMIIVFIIIGLMVMFRQRINPQTVITAQAALPGLVLGLILITFSYFMASLITDTAYIGVNLVGYYFNAAQSGSTPKLVGDIATENIGTIFSKFVTMISSGDIAGIINSILPTLDATVQFYLRLFAGLTGYQVGSSLGAPLGSLAGAALCVPAGTAGAVPTLGLSFLLSPLCSVFAGTLGGATLGTIFGTASSAFPGETFGLVLSFVAMAALIYTMFKLLLRLINSYLSIIFLTISAPFQFLAASLPGRQGIASDWILSLFGNILAFPAVFAVFYFVSFLLGPESTGGKFFGITTQLNPSGVQTLPLFGGISLSFIRIMIAFGALLATPTIPDIINKSIGKVSQAGQMIGQEISGDIKSGQGYAGQLQGRTGAVGSELKTALAGEMQYHKGPGGKWEPYYGKPGIFTYKK